MEDPTPANNNNNLHTPAEGGTRTGNGSGASTNGVVKGVVAPIVDFNHSRARFRERNLGYVFG